MSQPKPIDQRSTASQRMKASKPWTYRKHQHCIYKPLAQALQNLLRFTQDEPDTEQPT